MPRGRVAWGIIRMKSAITSPPSPALPDVAAKFKDTSRSIFFHGLPLAPRVPKGGGSEKSYQTLAQHLEVLASPTRLHLLHLLRTPRRLHDIRVEPSLVRSGENPERPLSRQGVARHLERMVEAGLVKRISGPDARHADTYVLNHQRVFALVNEMRNLSKLRPIATLAQGTARTVAETLARDLRLPSGPRILVAYGRDDGTVFSLQGPPGSRWRIGRALSCEIRLDYDLYVSSENSVVERTPEEFVVRDLRGNRNGTWVNWRRLPPGGSERLHPGDLLSVGQSMLVFQT